MNIPSSSKCAGNTNVNSPSETTNTSDEALSLDGRRTKASTSQNHLKPGDEPEESIHDLINRVTADVDFSKPLPSLSRTAPETTHTPNEALSLDGRTSNEKRTVKHLFSDTGPEYKSGFCSYKCRNYRSEVPPAINKHEECGSLHKAVLEGNKQNIVRFVKASSEDVNAKSGRIVDHFSVENRHLASGMTPLQLIINYGDNERLTEFLSTAKEAEKTVDYYHKSCSYPDELNKVVTAFDMAVYRKRWDMIKTLNTQGLDIHKAMNSLPRELWEHPHLLSNLFQIGISPAQMINNSGYDIPLIFKVINSRDYLSDCLKIIFEEAKDKELLISVFIDARSESHGGMSILEYFAKNKNESAFVGLIDLMKAESAEFSDKFINVIDKSGRTLLHHLCRNYHHGWPLRIHDSLELDATVRMTKKLLNEGFTKDLILQKDSNDLTAIDLLKGDCPTKDAGNYPFPTDHQQRMSHIIDNPYDRALSF